MKLRHQETPELDITAFMNLMVALVPFLLLSAAFSQIAVLQLVMPTGGGVVADEPEMQLELLVEPASLSLRNGSDKGTLLVQLPMRDGKYDLDRLEDELYKIKQRYPQRSDITLRARPDTSYETIIRLMDAVRVHHAGQGAAATEIELFPDISIGDADTAKDNG